MKLKEQSGNTLEGFFFPLKDFIGSLSSGTSFLLTLSLHGFLHAFTSWLHIGRTSEMSTLLAEKKGKKGQYLTPFKKVRGNLKLKLEKPRWLPG